MEVRSGEDSRGGVLHRVRRPRALSVRQLAHGDVEQREVAGDLRRHAAGERERVGGCERVGRVGDDELRAAVQHEAEAEIAIVAEVGRADEDVGAREAARRGPDRGERARDRLGTRGVGQRVRVRKADATFREWLCFAREK